MAWRKKKKIIYWCGKKKKKTYRENYKGDTLTSGLANETGFQKS